jgi:hypothetical protein
VHVAKKLMLQEEKKELALQFSFPWNKPVLKAM